MKIPDEIRTDRLIIRPFRESDLAEYLAFMTDAAVTQYLLLEPEQKMFAGAMAFFQVLLRSYQEDVPIWALAITTEEDGFIGSCGTSPVEGTIYECYYSLSRRYWGRGYATEATQGLIDYLFAHTPVTEIQAYMDPANPNSAGVAERVGMQRQGMTTHPRFGNEGLLYSIKKGDWDRFDSPEWS